MYRPSLSKDGRLQHVREKPEISDQTSYNLLEYYSYDAEMFFSLICLRKIVKLLYFMCIQTHTHTKTCYKYFNKLVFV